MTGAARHVVLTVALALLVTLALAGTVAAPARADPSGPADEPPAALDVVLEALSPAAPRPGDRLEVSGRVVNRTGAAAEDLAVRLRVSRTPVLSRSELGLLDSGERTRRGSSLPRTRLELPDLAPGEEARFTVRVPVEQLSLGVFGVYPLGVELQGRFDEEGRGSTSGPASTTWTFLPWSPDPLGASPTPIVWFWPLAAGPQRNAEGTFLDGSLAEELSTGGRLGRLASVGSEHAVTWVVDPALLDDAAAMVDGYETVATPGEPGARGQGDEAAAAFLEAVGAGGPGPTDPATVVLPYADPDVVALRRAGLWETVRRARLASTAVAAEVLPGPDEPAPGGVAAPAPALAPVEVAVPPGGVLDDATAQALVDAGYDALVLDSEAVPSPVSWTASARATVRLASGTRVPAVLTDGTLSALLAAGPGEHGHVRARQRFLSETAMVTAERPSDPRVVAVLPPREWAPPRGWARTLLEAVDGAPWVQLTTLPEALAEPAAPLPRGPLTYPEEAREAELPVDYLQEVAALDGRAATVSAVLTEDEGLVDATRAQQVTLSSAALRPDPALRRLLLGTAGDALDAALEGIRIVPASVLRPVESGAFPVSVANDLAQPVTVRLLFESSSPRLTVQPSEPVTIGPGRVEQVLVEADAIANGLVTVQAQLAAPDGTALGAPVDIQVRISQYGTVTVLITAAAAALLFGTAARRVVRRVRSARAGEGGAAASTSAEHLPPAQPVQQGARHRRTSGPAHDVAGTGRGRHVGSRRP